jgi:hypothetical protein
MDSGLMQPSHSKKTGWPFIYQGLGGSQLKTEISG